ncbi:Thymidylate kinase [Microbotryomycetes sp. JL221]|nr:Thymidylate kinase [Microbotryomycetes sp. JL221]
MSAKGSHAIVSANAVQRRGAFIVFEGLDRSGKSTQVTRLVDHLSKKGVKAIACRFPDRTTSTGKMIDSYLAQKSDLDDQAIHLLFSANRWERAQGILRDLEQGTTVICDRYAFSGIAFSAIKGLSYEWCRSPDIGLPAPDLTLFLDLSPEVAAQRGGYGAERYETETVQLAVRKMFKRIGEDVGSETWAVIDAGRDIQAVEQDIVERVDSTLGSAADKPVGKLWQE